MSNSLNRVWIHAVWSTKYREALINSEIEQVVFKEIKAQFTALDCSLIAINGTPDHIHCLFHLNSNRSIGQVLKQVKGSSSRYINENKLTMTIFSWQRGYGAFSVSESLVERLSKYISEQKEHHLSKSFKEEFNSLIEAQCS